MKRHFRYDGPKIKLLLFLYNIKVPIDMKTKLCLFASISTNHDRMFSAVTVDMIPSFMQIIAPCTCGFLVAGASRSASLHQARRRFWPWHGRALPVPAPASSSASPAI